MILRTGATQTTEEGRIPTMQPNRIQLFITVTITVSRKFEVLSGLDYTYLIENILVGLYFQSHWNERCKPRHISLLKRQTSLPKFNVFEKLNGCS